MVTALPGMNPVARGPGLTDGATTRVVLASDSPGAVSATGQGISVARTSTLAATPAQAKIGAGNFFGANINNPNSNAIFLQLYDKSTAPVVGTDTPLASLSIPGNGILDGPYPVGITFTTGLWYCVTTTATGNTAPTTVSTANIFYI